ncbi:alpha/beta fold hydrolase [Polymorphobacter fuscus]|nr:alpha/beta hydrolase [Polymorphobacter fuscus]NJC09178.1 pimeloyl-ACP methyl ester carboxylesterase [Polymorphobacter fuscus]
MTSGPIGKGRAILGWSAAAAAALGAATLFNRAAARRAEARYPPIGRILDVGGVAVHVVDTGYVAGGETIVLIHGNGSLLQDFLVSGVVDRLRTRHRVILFDRPGYGYTARPDDREWTAEAQARLFVAACGQLGVLRPVVVGHSWGTLVALAWALDHVGRVSRLVLLSGYYYPTMRPDSAMLNIAILPGARQVFANAVAPLQTRITGAGGIRMVFSPSETPDRFMDEIPFELMLRPTQMAASALDGAQMPANVARLAPRYRELRLPIGIAWGDGDKLVDHRTHSERLAREFGAPTLVLADAGHMIQHIDPEAIAAFIEKPRA